MAVIIKRARAIVMTYGFTVEDVQLSATPEAEWCEIFTPETTFSVNEGTGVTEVVMWSGSWPNPLDTEMGALPSLEEAARYASWLLKREAFYEEKWERLAEEGSECIRLTPGCRHKDYDHEDCEGY